MGKNKSGGSADQDGAHKFLVKAPVTSLPKGGGAIHGIGEKFSANPVTGTGSMSVPLGISPGRGGFGPQLALSYDSGAGNGPFGLGWGIGLPSIGVRTEPARPRYLNGQESDVFILSGAEDLIPFSTASGQRLADEDTTLHGKAYKVRLYRPRVEGLFARIERWTHVVDSSHIFWRTISRDNVMTWYGLDDSSRIFDPEDPQRIYQWLLCRTHDDKGNVSVYEYAAENAAGVKHADVWEGNRQALRQPDVDGANRYLKRIKYGNASPYLPKLRSEEGSEDTLPAAWMFEVVFDYGDHLGDFPSPYPDNPRGWAVRPDPFSSHRPGFELRTYRLCRRVLMFHHFADVPAVGADCLVRATEFDYATPADLQSPAQAGYTTLRSVTHRSYERSPGAAQPYACRALPQVSFKYSQPVVNQTVQTIAPEEVADLPVGTQGPAYRWVDLDGEGLSGILADRGWYYKSNLGDGRFGPWRQVDPLPSRAAAGTRYQFMDLEGDGTLAVVDFEAPVPGFQERDVDEGWKQHIPFARLPNVHWQDPNLRFLDLTGDGHADALITEDDVFTWYPSLGKEGFGPAERIHLPLDEEEGPRLVFADGTQTVFLADLCGDGLTHLVRVRNGSVCYWPNLGYGRFGRKVTLGNAPVFDHLDQFDPSRLRMTDIDGSGPVDLIYLGRDGAKLYFNRSGNSFSDALAVDLPLATENLDAVQVADLLGNGTACLVWNSHLPADTTSPVCYVDLMGGAPEAPEAHRKHEKPHLLIEIDNHLGATTEIEYTPSTRFYVQDKLAGQPWISNLPFPVHCVSRVTVRDVWRKTAFSTIYSYHHGHYDGLEREFRGFGRVEQCDIQNFGTFTQGNVDSPYVTQDHTLYQPPVKTITWYHTGVALQRPRVLGQFEAEYFPSRYRARLADAGGAAPFYERALPEPELPPSLTGDEWREALRTCKGMVLRQEIYELAMDEAAGPALDQAPVRLYSVATHNCRIRRLQARGENRHAVFLVSESEAISYHHELDLTQTGPLRPDPRIVHSLHLRYDEHGNPLQTVSIGYPRWRPGNFDGLPSPGLIHAAQAETHIAYAEIGYTRDVEVRAAGAASPVRHRRLRQPCETRSYELAGMAPAQDARYFTLQEFLTLDLSEQYPAQAGERASLQPLESRQYHEHVDGTTRQKRLVEHARTLYFDDAADSSSPIAPLAFGHHGPRGLKYEDYKLALTDDLLDAVFKTRDPHTGAVVDDKLAWAVNGGTAREFFDEPIAQGSPYLKSGYVRGSSIDPALAGQYWMRSGMAGFSQGRIAPDHFFLPDRYVDPFGNPTTLRYDGRKLFVVASTDAMGNTSGIVVSPDGSPRFDYRVLTPIELVDANGNLSEVCFDILGLPIAAAVKGKFREPEAGDPTQSPWQADRLDGFDLALRNPEPDAVMGFCNSVVMNEALAAEWLGSATTRFVYFFGDAANNLPPGACTITREQHHVEVSPLQVSLECSDGSGAVLMKKVQAEPAPGATDLRWIVNGRTILNNKGKPVRQYEPVFSAVGFGPEEPEENGVSTTTYYDAAGRPRRVEMPDGTFSRVEFSPWHSLSYDADDTVLDSAWYRERFSVPPENSLPIGADGRITATPEQRAAWLAARHADTPGQMHFDSLGRDIIAIAHNRVEDAAGAHIFDGRSWKDEYHLTHTRLDAEGKPLWIRDARGHLVMQYISPPKANNDPGHGLSSSAPCYDIAGNLLYQHSMDAGDRWMITDAAGKPLLAWDLNDAGPGTPVQRRLYRTEYDALHRPTAQWLQVGAQPPLQIEVFEYCDTWAPQGAANLPDAQDRNLIGQAVRHYDASGLAAVERMDLSGQPAHVTRTFILPQADRNAPAVDWSQNRGNLLGSETWHQLTEYDALGRMTRLYNWHLGAGSPVAVYLPSYGRRGMLDSERLIVGAIKRDSGAGHEAGTAHQAINSIRYDAKGQRESLELGNGVVTTYRYDQQTYRLVNLHARRPVAEACSAGKTSLFRDNHILLDLNYCYDPTGNITEIHDEALTTYYSHNEAVEPVKRYEYDALYRLTSATGREHANAAAQELAPLVEDLPCLADNNFRGYQQTYTYDSVGNILRMRHHTRNGGGWTRHYQYAFDDLAHQTASNRLWRTWQGDASWDGSNANNKVTYGYDAHGSMLNHGAVPQDFHLRWDHRDMIASINLGNGQAWYQYDASKQRTRKWIDRADQPGGGNTQNITEERLYLSGLERYTQTVNGQWKQTIETLHLFDDEQRMLMVDQVNDAQQGASTLLRYTLSNHLGSSTLELDEAARIISCEDYHPYGTSACRAGRSDAEVKRKRYRYTGMERDEESSLCAHGTRQFESTIGRWLSADSAGISDGVNLYLYCAADPIRRSDPSGRASFASGGKLSASLINSGEPEHPTFLDPDRYIGSLSPGVMEKSEDDPDVSYRQELKGALVADRQDFGGSEIRGRTDAKSMITDWSRAKESSGDASYYWRMFEQSQLRHQAIHEGQVAGLKFAGVYYTVGLAGVLGGYAFGAAATGVAGYFGLGTVSTLMAGGAGGGFGYSLFSQSAGVALGVQRNFSFTRLGMDTVVGGGFGLLSAGMHWYTFPVNSTWVRGMTGQIGAGRYGWQFVIKDAGGKIGPPVGDKQFDAPVRSGLHRAHLHGHFLGGGGKTVYSTPRLNTSWMKSFENAGARFGGDLYAEALRGGGYTSLSWRAFTPRGNISLGIQNLMEPVANVPTFRGVFGRNYRIQPGDSVYFGFDD